MNPLEEYARRLELTGGAGLWKWNHYFEIYHRHFERFRGQPISLLEIGVYSGGSLAMWRDYFGPQARIIGVDIAPECEAYRADGFDIFIGNQADPEFWTDFKTAVPQLDIVIDDGSHKPRHQIATAQQLLAHLQMGGVYLCEDIHGYPESPFSAYVAELAAGLNDHRGFEANRESDDRRLVKVPTVWQANCHSIHLYPYVAVIEKNRERVAEFVAPKRGTSWQPFRP